MISGDTIAALSSAAAPAARVLLRLSGPEAFSIVARLSPDAAVEVGAARTRLCFAGLVVPAWLYAFRAPRSYSGEDVVEFHVPGNPILARMLLDELLRLGARPAEPGEFTARAYFNGRMDLTEAEGVAATIHANSERELLAARQLLSGELARRLRPLMDGLADALALVEVGIDFSEEDVSFISAEQVAGRAGEADRSLRRLVAESARFERLVHEPHLVLVGRPNAGKSTLLNALAGVDRAVVSPVAGTTRDAISAEVILPRGLVRVTDVAGIEEGLPPEADSSPQAHVSRQMRARALQAVESADLLLLVHDLTDPDPPLAPPRDPDLIIFTKLDLAPSIHAPLPHSPTLPSVSLSAATGRNLDVLRERLSDLAFSTARGSALALNARHLRAIDEATAALSRVLDLARANPSPELLALELRDALDALGGILGRITPDDVLGRVFSTFCIGK